MGRLPFSAAEFWSQFRGKTPNFFRSDGKTLSASVFSSYHSSGNAERFRLNGKTLDAERFFIVTVPAERDSGKTSGVFPSIGFSADSGHSKAIFVIFSVEPKTPSIQII